MPDVTTTVITATSPTVVTRQKYEEVQAELDELMKQRENLEESLLTLETSIYSSEGSYLEESGNLIRGFDGYLKPSSQQDKKKKDISKEARLFSNSSSSSRKARKMKVKLSWELVNSFSEYLNADSDEEDEEELDAYNDSVQRLKDADEITKAMTRDEYVHYSECRQASFTYRKAKRFREWANMSAYIDMKPNDDIIDILGFLTFEMVSKLTETALLVKQETDRDFTSNNLNNKLNKFRQMYLQNGYDGENGIHLFSKPPPEQTPLQPSHIHEAFRRLQMDSQPMKIFRGGLNRTK
ncbi:1169_t:CDS:2, partial [Entrophospora sp. SA101]